VESEYAPQKTSALSGRKRDATFIMMNPGSSRPMTAVDNRIHADAIHKMAVLLVSTKLDTTQYQVTRAMHYCDWRHVRVLNLSGLRCTKSGLFFKEFKGRAEGQLFDARQESNTPSVSAGKPLFANVGGAESGALSEVSPSPALSLLVKLTASLTADEHAVPARLLGQGEGEAARAAS
jgi:hypothetical protein